MQIKPTFLPLMERFGVTLIQEKGLMLGPVASGSKEIWIELSNELLYLKSLAQPVEKLWTGKVGGQK